MLTGRSSRAMSVLPFSNRAADIANRRDEVAALISAEAGLCTKDAGFTKRAAWDVFLFGANEVLKDDGQVFSCDLTHHGKKRRVIRSAVLLGVITAITPSITR